MQFNNEQLHDIKGWIIDHRKGILKKADNATDTEFQDYLRNQAEEMKTIIDSINKHRLGNALAGIDKLEILNDPMYVNFKKFHGMSQDSQNDYTKGCIQTANALMPVILDLILETLKDH